MLKRVSRMGELLGAHSSEESGTDSEGDEDPEVRELLARLEAEEEGESESEAEDEVEDDEDDENKFCGRGKTVELEDKAVITNVGPVERYICSVCPEKEMHKKVQVEMHINSKFHKRNAHKAKKESRPQEVVEKLKAKAEERRKRRWEKKKAERKEKRKAKMAGDGSKPGEQTTKSENGWSTNNLSSISHLSLLEGGVTDQKQKSSGKKSDNAPKPPAEQTGKPSAKKQKTENETLLQQAKAEVKTPTGGKKAVATAKSEEKKPKTPPATPKTAEVKAKSGKKPNTAKKEQESAKNPQPVTSAVDQSETTETAKKGKSTTAANTQQQKPKPKGGVQSPKTPAPAKRKQNTGGKSAAKKLKTA
eukprot:comp23392_c3_seq1/m.38762 comp23392_c3_seq1/g.38762  ORF comp23392_c3_seq1/g.38762 comp23392_c3_seq1/m.38762 type:complete len:362 (-) comp23392_c3_seq1:180-1265(-)